MFGILLGIIFALLSYIYPNIMNVTVIANIIFVLLFVLWTGAADPINKLSELSRGILIAWVCYMTTYSIAILVSIGFGCSYGQMWL